VRRGTLLVVIAAASTTLACGFFSTGPTLDGPDIFTPAHRGIADATRDFLMVRPSAEQPIPFPHKTHIEKGVLCVDCHETVEKGPIAGIPSVKTCMICHESMATDRPNIQKVADYAKRKVEIPWQRVYGYPQEAHVRFQHAPHIRAKVDCSSCHGDVKNMMVAERAVDLKMGYCVDCHRSKQAPNDCLTCHY